VPLLPLTLWAFGLISLWMLLAWTIAVRVRNAGVGDVACHSSFALLMIWFATASPSGEPTRLWLFGTMVTAWSVRFAYRVGRHVWLKHPDEDGQYARWREDWGASNDNVEAQLFWFFQGRGVIALLLSSPLLIVALNPARSLHTVEWFAMGLWVVGFLGGTLADAQLERFRAEPGNRNRVCTTGLRRYSRHPVYFCDWIVWNSFALFALGSDIGWMTVYTPVMMLYLLLFVSGIPQREKTLERRFGDEYVTYQRRTSMFIPWRQKSPPRRAGSPRPRAITPPAIGHLSSESSTDQERAS